MRKTVFTAVAAMAIMAMSGCSSNVISPLDGIEFKVSGPDGYGVLEKFEIGENKGFNKINAELDKASDNVDLINGAGLLYLKESIDCTADKTENLSNGDVITIACEYNPEVFKKLKWTVKDTEKKIKVSGLQKAEELDMFKDLQFEYTLIPDSYPTGYWWDSFTLAITNSSDNPKLQKLKYTYDYDTQTESQCLKTDYRDVSQYEEYGFIPANGEFKKSGEIPAPEYVKVENQKSLAPDVMEKYEEYADEFGKELMDREYKVKSIYFDDEDHPVLNITDADFWYDYDAEYTKPMLCLTLSNGMHYLFDWEQFGTHQMWRMPDGSLVDNERELFSEWLQGNDTVYYCWSDDLF